MTLFNKIIAAAREFRAMYETSVFSYRGISLRNRLNQECASSITHLRALKEGSYSISFFSSPLGCMWGMKPFFSTTASLPTYAASRHKFWEISPTGSTTTLAFSNGSSKTLSCRFAPLTTSDKGTPFSSTSRCSFVPFFSPIRGVRADGLLRKRGFNIRTVGRFPKPGDTLQRIIFSQATFPNISKHSGLGTLLKLAMDHCRPDDLKLFTRQPVPDNSCTEHIDDCGKVQTIRVLSLPAAPWFVQVCFGFFGSRVFRDQWFHQIPKLVGNLLFFNTCHALPPSFNFLTDHPGFMARLQ